MTADGKQLQSHGPRRAVVSELLRYFFFDFAMISNQYDINEIK